MGQDEDRGARLMALKDQATKLQSKIDQAKGALSEEMKRLQDTFDCDTLDAARELLTAKKAESEKAREAFDTKFKEFEGKWKETLATM